MADEVKKKSEELDVELDSVIDKMIEKNKGYKYTEGLTVENWEKEIEKIPFFMTKSPEDGEEVSAGVAALQALKYEDEDPTARATAYKEEGNYEYKQKNFRKAILAYTEGIKAKCEDDNLNAVLYTNRATVNFTIGNNRSALKDTMMAHKYDPKYVKAIVRGASACFNLKIYDHTKAWCDKGLKIEPDNEKLLKLRKDAVAEQKKAERDQRKAKLKEKKKNEEVDALIDAIKSRNIRIEETKADEDDDDDDDDNYDENDEESRLRKNLAKFNLDPNHPTGARLQMDSENRLYWPVMFYYPEYKQTDFIGAFCEENSFIEHFQVMFGRDSAPWDEENKYEPDMLEVYFEDQESGKLCHVESSCPLKNVLSDKRFIVCQGTPAFVILVKKSSFKKEFLKHCTVEKF
ncbi:tetratricopeptide repeat protein 4-like [Actinia tenebrosa]|uniref:Tetratricopeptide repeat protein 4-like n=1 Tax=Actinia tenebrosa TaxID=6105 RepID=A0A6P8HMR0_ACTTE|nr:tetratricopeptide repeat protein 4-like [Actinia tenebrosa]